jgi:hypothetical protein
LHYFSLKDSEIFYRKANVLLVSVKIHTDKLNYMIKTPFSVLLLIVLLLPLSGISGPTGKSPSQVLLISRKNNHEWQNTSPTFLQILEEKGFFKVDITEMPDTLKASVLNNYQVIASNWKAFSERCQAFFGISEFNLCEQL